MQAYAINDNRHYSTWSEAVAQALVTVLVCNHRPWPIVIILVLVSSILISILIRGILVILVSVSVVVIIVLGSVLVCFGLRQSVSMHERTVRPCWLRPGSLGPDRTRVAKVTKYNK